MPYRPKTIFAKKDDLDKDDPKKIIYGKEFGVEFDAISATFDEVQAGFDQVKDKLEAGGYSMEEAPAGGSQYGRQEINGTMTWTVVNTSSGGGGSYDDTQIKADLATEAQARIDGDAALDLRIDAVEDSITDGGGFVDAPNDGKLYGRQSEGWSEVPDGGVSDWADIENKPTEFPPEAHDHTIANVTGLSDALDDKSNVGHKHVIADVTGLQDALNNAAYAVAIADTPPENGKSGDTWFDSTEGEGALYIHDGDVWFSSNTFSRGASGGIEEAPEDGIQYARQDATWEPVEAYDDSGITDALAQEVADRGAGDLALQGQIDAEVADRGAGDLALQGQIDALGSGGGGGWELLATVKAASSSNVVLSQITDEFDDYKIIVSDVVCSTKAELHMQVAINGSYKTAGYGFHNDHSHTNNSSYAGIANNNTSAFSLFLDLIPGNTTLNSIEVSAFGANNPSGSKTFFWHGMYYYNYGYLAVGGGYQVAAGKLTGIKFLMSSGTITSGTFKIYGIKK